MVFADVDQEVATSEDRNVALVISTGDRGLTFSYMLQPSVAHKPYY